MNSLVIVVALATAIYADAASLGNNYVNSAEINNELQKTYILPATKSRPSYVAVPVSVLNTHNPTNAAEVSQEIIVSPTLKIKSNEVQLPPSISAALTKSTQKTIKNTVQKIIQKTVIPSKSPKLSTNTYLPPVLKAKTSHDHLPELIDKPPKAIQQRVKTATNLPIPVKVSKINDISSTLKPTKPIEIIKTSIAAQTIDKTIQTNIDTLPVPVKVTQKPNIPTPSTAKFPEVDAPIIIPSSKTIQKTVNILPEPVKVTKITEISSTFKTKTSDVKTGSASIPSAPVQVPKSTYTASTLKKESLNSPSSPVQVAQRIDVSSTLNTKSSDVKTVNTFTPPAPVLNINTASTLQTKSSDVKTVSTYTPPAPVQNTNSASILKIKTSEVKIGSNSIPSAPVQVSKTSDNTSTLKSKLPEVKVSPLVTTSTPVKTVQKTVNISIPPTPVQVVQRTDTSSELKTKPADVKTVNTFTPSTPIQVSKASQTSEVKKVVVSIPPAPVQVSKNTNIGSTLQTQTSEVKIVIPSTPVQVTKNTATSSTLKTKLPEVPAPQLVITATPLKTVEKTEKISIPPTTVQASKTTNTASTLKTQSSDVSKANTSIPPASVQVSQRIDISSTKTSEVKTSTPLKNNEKITATQPKPVQASKTTSPPATLKSPPSLWHLPKVIDIVQKTIKSSVNSNLKPLQAEEPDITKIVEGSVHGPANHYLPPDPNDLYENVEVFTSEGYKTERRLKSTS